MRIATEGDAVRIDQEYMAIGIQHAVDLAGQISDHDIQRDRGRIIGDEVHRIALADAEVAPVDQRAVAGLRHLQCVGGIGDAYRALHHNRIARQHLGLCATCPGQRQCQDKWFQPRAIERLRASATGDDPTAAGSFRRHLDLAQCAVEHKAVNAIHGDVLRK